MDRIPPETILLIKNYISHLEKNHIRVRKAVVFGSYARGTADEWSDIDVALVSDDFEGVRYLDRSKIRKFTRECSSLLSPLPFKTEEFSDQDPFVRHILANGYIISP